MTESQPTLVMATNEENRNYQIAVAALTGIKVPNAEHQ
jgi:hypothetical protein